MCSDSIIGSASDQKINRPYSLIGFLCHFGLKTGIHFSFCGLESGMVFEETRGVYKRIYRLNPKYLLCFSKNMQTQKFKSQLMFVFFTVGPLRKQV